MEVVGVGGMKQLGLGVKAKVVHIGEVLVNKIILYSRLVFEDVYSLQFSFIPSVLTFYLLTLSYLELLSTFDNNITQTREVFLES